MATLHLAVQKASVFILQRPDFEYLNVPEKPQKMSNIQNDTHVHISKTGFSIHWAGGKQTNKTS